MSVSNIAGAGGHFSAPVLEGSFSSLSGELAVLVLETQETCREVERDALQQARVDYTTALREEVAALREQADAARTGAMFEAGLTVVAGGVGVWGATRQCDDPWQAGVAESVGKLAKPLGGVVGHNYGAAAAKSAQGAQQQASWEIEDHRDAIRDAENAQSKALDWLSSSIDRDAATMAAILSNKV